MEKLNIPDREVCNEPTTTGDIHPQNEPYNAWLFNGDNFRNGLSNTPFRADDEHINTSNLLRDLFVRLRKEYEIPEDMLCYYTTDRACKNNILYNISKNPIDSTINTVKFYEESSVFLTRFFDGMVKHSDGSYIICCSTETTDYLVVFTHDIDHFFNTIKTTHPPSYDPGTYYIEHTTFGSKLTSVTTTSTEPPVLNDNLSDTLLEEIMSFKDNEKLYIDNDFDYKRGILLYGEPGNGKTSFIRYLLSNLRDSVNIICDCRNLNDVDFIYGLLNKNKGLKDTFKVIVLEDIDGVDSCIRSKVLNMIDGIVPTHNTVFIATTNYPTNLDDGLTNRPSRFDTLHRIDLPNEHSRETLLTKYFPELNYDLLTQAVRKTDGFRGSYFKELYLITQLFDLDILTAIQTLYDKFKNFREFRDTQSTNYMG